MDSTIIQEAEKDIIKNRISSIQNQITDFDKQKKLLQTEINNLLFRLSNIENEEELTQQRKDELKIEEHFFFPNFLKKKFIIQNKDIINFSISPDNKKVIIAYDKIHNFLSIYDLETEKEIWNHNYNTNIYNICWKDNESFFLECESTIYYYNYITNNNQNIKTFDNGTIIRKIGFIYNCIVYTIISNTNDNNIYLINKNTYEETVLQGHNQIPIKIISHYLTDHMISLSSSELKFWNLTTQTCIKTQNANILGNYNFINIYPFHNKHQMLLHMLNSLEIIDYNGTTIDKIEDVNPYTINGGTITNNNEYFIYNENKNIYFHNFNKKNILLKMEKDVRFLKISSDDKFVLICNRETSSLEVWLFGKDEPKPVRKV